MSLTKELFAFIRTVSKTLIYLPGNLLVIVWEAGQQEALFLKEIGIDSLVQHSRSLH